MGIRFYCPNGHKLNVKAFQAGRKGICPYCAAKIQIPLQSTRRSAKQPATVTHGAAAGPAATKTAGFSSVPIHDYGSPPVKSPPAGERSSPVRTSFSSPVQAEQPAHYAPAPQSAPVTPVDPAALTASGPQPTGAPSYGPAPSAVAESDSSSVLGAAPAPSGPSSAVPRDPLREGGDVVWYVRPPTGGQFGPASPDVMRTWIDQGRVSPDSLVWREGWRDWQAAGEIFPQLGAGQETSPFGQLLPGVSGQAAAPAAATGQLARSRRRSQTIQVATVTALIIVVAILLVVFLWVLNQ